MSYYFEVMNRKFNEVITEQQFDTLRETVFLSLLKEILYSSSSAHNSESEQIQLLTTVFGMNQEAINQRVRAFIEYQRNK